ncbi:hypothetical protein [Alphaproteobacteria bacterium endosymbiont of Tiliacea citrago]|uniref:hypothetical protein n=1 Tax=Alphaproteobacteria bacterium endosymbiont of Tiliacea citrago TaxID=3077944 RepID=UPI00313C6BBC
MRFFLFLFHFVHSPSLANQNQNNIEPGLDHLLAANEQKLHIYFINLFDITHSKDFYGIQNFQYLMIKDSVFMFNRFFSRNKENFDQCNAVFRYVKYYTNSLNEEEEKEKEFFNLENSKERSEYLQMINRYHVNNLKHIIVQERTKRVRSESKATSDQNRKIVRSE